jgi:NAD(P)-dependent dehydrogenase (short-subunit alcohol dehydrogenase family)
MTMVDAFRFDGKRALVLGGATGMGAAAAELLVEAGAEVVVTDRSSIDTAVDECGGPVDVLLACAGVADGTPGIERINFIGHRHLIDRLIADSTLGRGSAIGFISSAAGLGWQPHLPEIQELLATPDFDTAVAWVEAHHKADYLSSKQVVCAYVASRAFPFLKQGIRINAICPGPTDTPLARANKDTWLGFASDYRAELGIEVSTPLDQAYPLVFLCSEAAAAVTGITMVTDVGYMSSGITGSFPGATAIATMLLDG